MSLPRNTAPTAQKLAPQLSAEKVQWTQESLDQALQSFPPLTQKLDQAHNNRDREKILQLQRELKAKGYDVAVNGHYDARMTAAVKVLQKKLGVPPDGDFGQLTASAYWGAPKELCPPYGIKKMNLTGFTPTELSTAYEGTRVDYGSVIGSFGAPQSRHEARMEARDVAHQMHMRVTSEYRTEKHNADVGGVPNSLHTHTDQYGTSLGLDVAGTSAQMAAYASAMRTLLPREEGWRVIHEGNHVHVQG
jgi:peptidoglycan hydrolase-like protein with peptidoglycan-binding domain